MRLVFMTVLILGAECAYASLACGGYGSLQQFTEEQQVTKGTGECPNLCPSNSFYSSWLRPIAEYCIDTCQRCSCRVGIGGSSLLLWSDCPSPTDPKYDLQCALNGAVGAALVPYIIVPVLSGPYTGDCSALCGTQCPTTASWQFWWQSDNGVCACGCQQCTCPTPNPVGGPASVSLWAPCPPPVLSPSSPRLDCSSSGGSLTPLAYTHVPYLSLRYTGDCNALCASTCPQQWASAFAYSNNGVCACECQQCTCGNGYTRMDGGNSPYCQALQCTMNVPDSVSIQYTANALTSVDVACNDDALLFINGAVQSTQTVSVECMTSGVFAVQPECRAISLVCSSSTVCDSCVADTVTSRHCGWCTSLSSSSLGSCIGAKFISATGKYEPLVPNSCARSLFFPAASTSSTCSELSSRCALRDCASCVTEDTADGYCGWCATTGACVPASDAHNSPAINRQCTAPGSFIPSGAPSGCPSQNNDVLLSPLYDFPDCPEALSVPALHVLVANSGTLVFGVLVSWLMPGLSMAAYLTHIVSFLYMEVSLAYFSVHDYMYWSTSPHWSSMVRCTLNREYNELMLIKGMLRLQVASRLLVLLRFNQDVFGGGDRNFKLVKLIVNILSLLYLPAVIVRSILLSVASIAYAWPYAYLTMFSLPTMIVLIAYVQKRAGEHVAVLNAYCDESPEERKISTDSPELNSSMLPSDLRARLSAVLSALEALADLHFRYQVVTSVLGVLSIYSSIVAFDYQYGNIGVGYAEAFTYFASFRPPFMMYYQETFNAYKALLYS